MAILDEIDSGLDIDALRDVSKAVNALKNDNTGVLMVTHYKVRSFFWSGERFLLNTCYVVISESFRRTKITRFCDGV